MLILLITVSSSQVSYQRPEEGREKAVQELMTEDIIVYMTYYSPSIYQPVIYGDASSTRPCGLLVLLVVVGIDMGLLSLLLQDRSEFVFADAAEERADIMRFLDHPLQTANNQISSDRQLLITLAMLPREYFV